jgi:uncharacterized protein (DUF433 family)
VIKQLVDEAERCWRYPGIVFRGEDQHRRAWIVGSAFDVWELIWTLNDLKGDANSVASQYNVDKSQIRLALAYYGEFPEEIDELIAWNRRPLSAWQAEYPLIESVVIED